MYKSAITINYDVKMFKTKLIVKYTKQNKK